MQNFEIRKTFHTFVRNLQTMNRITINIFLAITLYIWGNSAKSQTAPLYQESQHPKYEVRAVWLTTIGGIDWPHSYAQTSTGTAKQKQELCGILDRLKQANVNTVIIQTRIRATVIYPSSYEPWDGCLSGNPGVSPGYDALQFAVEECHKRGMECHAWVVTIPVGRWNGTGCRHLRRTHPKLLRKIGNEGYMNPEAEGTAEYIADICREITRKYDIDGIHLDYIRYPETWRITIPRQKGREYITRIVRAVNHAVKKEKPWVKMSCSPVGKHSDLSRYSSNGWNAYWKVCQDAQGWLREGLMDQLYPMMYFRNNQFFPFAIDWVENSYGKTVVPGLGIYFLDPHEGKWQLTDVTREMHVLRRIGIGHAYFRSKFFTDNTKGIYDYVTRYIDQYPALIPPMTWASSAKPAAPEYLRVEYGSKTQLNWSGDTPYYNIYSSYDFPVDINDAGNLIAQRLQGKSLTVDTDRGRFYAITAMDRYGNESLPVQSYSKPAFTTGNMLKHDGRLLQLPDNANILDAEYITIETLQGSIIATRPYKGVAVSISGIPNGVYVVRSLNRKGLTHRLGHFLIKR